MSLSEEFPWLEGAVGIFEPVATMGTGMLGEIPAGFSGLLELARTGDPELAAQAVQEAQERMTYMPRTEAGMENLGRVGRGMEALMDWGGVVDAPSMKDILAQYQTQSSRLLPSAGSAILEGALSSVVPLPARRAGKLAKAADNVPDRVYYHGSDYPWWSDPDFDVAYSGKGYGPEGQFGINRTSEEFGPVSFSLAKDRATAEAYGPHVGEFRLRGEVYPDLYDATEQARAAGVNVDQWVMDQGYVGAYLDELDDVRIYDTSAIVPVADNGSQLGRLADDQVYYHGTDRDFDEFKVGEHDELPLMSVSITDDPAYASTYASDDWGRRGSMHHTQDPGSALTDREALRRLRAGEPVYAGEGANQYRLGEMRTSVFSDPYMMSPDQWKGPENLPKSRLWSAPAQPTPSTTSGSGPNVRPVRISGRIISEDEMFDLLENVHGEDWVGNLSNQEVSQMLLDRGITGVAWGGDEIAMVDPTAIRSAYEGRLGDPVPQPEGRLTTYTPELPEKPADQPLLNLPDPRTLSGPVKSTVGKALKPLSRPAVRAREKMRAAGETVVDETARRQGRLLLPEDLHGNVLVPVSGDRTRAGGRLLEVRGVPLRGALELEGGPGFAEQHAGTGAAWASMKGAAGSKQANITKAAEETGLTPYGVYTAMGPEGSNFSHHVAEGMLRQVPNLDISKTAKRDFDRFVREKAVPSQRIPDWVGIDSDEALDQILGRGNFPMEGSGEIRKRLVNAMGSAQFRDVGFPSYLDTLEAVNDPRLAGQGVGASGLVAFEGAPGAPLIRETGHASYSHDIPGEYVGGLERSVPLDIMFPKTVGKLMEEGKTNIPRSFQMSHHYEIADDEWLENLLRYLEDPYL